MDENELTLARAEIARLEQELTIARHEHLELLGKMRQARETLVDSVEIPDNKERHAKALRALDLLAPDKKTKSKVTEIRNIHLFIRYLGMIQVHPPYETPPPGTKLTKKEALDSLVCDLTHGCDIKECDYLVCFAKKRQNVIQRLKRGLAAMIAREDIVHMSDHSWLHGALPSSWASNDKSPLL